MSETTSASAPSSGVTPSSAAEQAPAEPSAPAPAPGPTPVAEAPVASPEPTAAPKETAQATSTSEVPTATLVPTPEVVPTTTSATTATGTPEPTAVPEKPAQIEASTITSAPNANDTSAEKPNIEEVSPATATLTTTTEPELVEEQNPLTNKFTEDEWTALKKFRAQLPDLFADAFPDKEAARTSPINIWGISIDPQSAHKDARVSVILMKFLRARNLNINEARDMLIGTLRWRDTFDILVALEEDFPKEVFGNLGHIYGRDKEGHPVVYNIYGGTQDLKAVFSDVQRFIRWRVGFMEQSMHELDFIEVDQMLQIHDYEGVSLTSRDANSKAAASEASNIFSAHYPEVLYKKFFVNVPTILNWLFWAFRAIISAKTLAKMSVVGTGTHALKKTLGEYIDLKELPTKYGGNAEAF